MKYIRLLIEYDGTAYHGWQSQKSGGTIQDIISSCLSEITGAEVRLTGASRTDAGVHALGQVAMFGTDSSLSPEVIMRAMNAKLPGDIRILESKETEASFHPRYGATKKSYFYLISTGPQRSAFLHKYVWEQRTALDVPGMKSAALHLLGRHDFSSFRGSGCGAKTTTRNIRSIDIECLQNIDFMTASIKGEFIRVRIEADAFLRHMVRNIVGTLAEVGKGNITPDEIRDILQSCDRTKAGPTAPGKGLFLEQITY